MKYNQRTLAKTELKSVCILQAMMLANLVEDTNKHSSLTNFCLAEAYLLAHAGFLQFHELVQLRSSNVHIDSFMLKLGMGQSKTNQLCIGKPSSHNLDWKHNMLCSNAGMMYV